MKLSETATNIGSTYSVADYVEYKKTGNKNLFEEIIDRLILDGVAGMNESFRNSISSLSPSKKRMAILSLLDKDRNLFTRIKALIDDKLISNMDHIKDVITMLREYVKVGEVEKKKFGEVMTPLELVKEMLATLPVEVWSNPNLKWLDPANGTGPYPTMVIYRLMNGLKDWEPNEEKRYKHIIENMIYVAELQPKNMFLYMCVVDPLDKYDLNIYTGSFLDEGFDRHMRAVWGVDRFDIVMGNPPYQETSISGRSKGGGKGGDNNLWSKFILKSLNLCDILVFINPPSFLSPGHKVLTEFNKSGGLKYLKIFDKSPFDAATQACYYTWIKGYKEKTKVDGKEVDLSSGILPNSSNILDLSIFGKFFSDNHEKISFKRTCSLHTSNKKQFISKTPSDIFCYRLLSGSKVLYSSIKSDYHDLKKVVVSRSGYLNPQYDDMLSSLSESNFFIEVINKEKGDKIINLLNSKLYTYCLNKSKFSGFFSGEVIKNIPLVIFNSDEQLFEYFGITDDEIKLIKCGK